MDFCRIGISEATGLHQCIGQRIRRNAKKMNSIGADFNKCKFQECVCERIFKHGKIKSVAIGQRDIEKNVCSATVAETHNHIVGHACNIGFRAIGGMIG
ncbi:hypothetical protein DSECCO2_521140 [anaerobic digester metagenome]